MRKIPYALLRLTVLLTLFAWLIFPMLVSAQQGRPPRPLGQRMPPQQRQQRQQQQQSAPQTWNHTIAADAGSTAAPLLIGIGIHIEPFGSKYAGTKKAGQPNRPLDYRIPMFFQRHLQDLKALIAIVEKHGGKLTVQAQTPFTDMLVQNKVTLFAELEKKGHEIALHFHEDAHLGPNPENLPQSQWTEFMTGEIVQIKKAGATKVRYWSGGNLYPNLIAAGADAGLEILGDHKNPRTQQTFPELLAVNPWRPAGGPTETDISAFAKHDPNGRIIYLPGGQFTNTGFGAKQQLGKEGQAFERLTVGLDQSLRAARPDRVNVFRLTIHPGEFKGGPQGNFDIVERWLTQVVDPLVKAGKLKWATFSEMADAYKTWEQAHPGVEPRAAVTATPSLTTPATPTATTATPKTTTGKAGYMSFVINVHDTVNVNESAETLLRLTRIYQQHGVRGDFYMTGPVVAAYQQKRPDVLVALRDAGMTISYHVRPPHPLYAGFDASLKGLDDAALKKRLTDYETYAQNLATAEIDPARAGGYTLVKTVFGTSPVVVGAPNPDRAIKATALAIYKEMGGKMVVWYHEKGAKLDQPFEYHDGLLARPSDFSITRWAIPDLPTQSGKPDPFWWNLIASPKHGSAFTPVTRLKTELAAWQGPRAPFVTSLIHENNFYRKGPEGWKAFYFRNADTTQPLPPPYDLTLTPAGTPRPEAEQAAIWQAYEDMVAYAAQNMSVVTSADIVQMAAAGTY